MKVTPVPLGFDLCSNAPGYVRGEGLHLSTLYNDLYADLEPNRYTGGPLDRVRAGLGLAFEEKVEQILLAEDLAMRPGEFTTPEGIIFSSDLLMFTNETRIGEIKLTWLSSREWPREPAHGFPPHANKYITQMACQCRAMGTPYATLIAYFVNGDNNRSLFKDGGMAPTLLRYEIEFSPRELREEWSAVLNHARRKKLL